MVTFITNNKEACDKEVAEVITKSINKILQTKESTVLGVVGGRSVSGVFQALRSKPVPWGRVHIFMIDERMVPITDSESNFHLAKQNFLNDLIKKGVLSEDNIHPFRVEQGIEEYQQELENYGGVFDIILLSSGEDGHVGALFPKYSVKDKGKFFITINHSPKPPPKRMTASVNLLKRSKVAIILFYGESKKEAYEKFNNDEISLTNCPAKLVLGIEECFVATDLE